MFDVPGVSRLVLARFVPSFRVQLSRARTCTSPEASAAALVAKLCTSSYVSRPFHNPNRARSATDGPFVRALFAPFRPQTSRANVPPSFHRRFAPRKRRMCSSIVAPVVATSRRRMRSKDARLCRGTSSKQLHPFDPDTRGFEPKEPRRAPGCEGCNWSTAVARHTSRCTSGG